MLENDDPTKSRGNSANREHGSASVGGHSSLPGLTARDLFFELGETDNARLVFPLLQAEVKGLTVRCLDVESELKEPPPADPWLIIIDDVGARLGFIEKDYEETKRWLFEAADCIEIMTRDPRRSSYNEFIKMASKGQRILLIDTIDEHLEEWLYEILTNSSGPNRRRPMEISVGVQRSIRLRPA